MKKVVRVSCLTLLLLLASTSFFRASGADWRTASRSSAGITPNAKEFSGAIVQVYAARTFGWRGVLAVHTWIATKEVDATDYSVHQVIGWRKRRNLPVVSSNIDIPDRLWFGSKPELLVDIRGPEAEPIVTEVMRAVNAYPYQNDYTMWPGPNSNTFTAFVGRQVPVLKLNLPPTAIGKDFLTNSIVGRTPSGGGGQLSLYGVLGVMVSEEEGLEVNILGLNFGINPMKLHLRLPGFGTIGQ